MDIIDDIFNEFVNNEKESKEFLLFLNQRFPDSTFQLFLPDGNSVFLKEKLPVHKNIIDNIIDNIIKKATQKNSLICNQESGSLLVYAMSAVEFNGVLAFCIPEQNSDSPLKYGPATIQLGVEFYTFQKNSAKKINTLDNQKKQRDRKIDTLENKYQEILEENYRSHQIIQKKQANYSKTLKAEIKSQTKELQRTYDLLKERSDFQQKILDTAATAIYTVDPDKRITNVNDEFCLITGFNKEEIVGKHCDILKHNSCNTDCLLFKPDQSGKIEKQQCKMITKDNMERTIIKNAGIIFDSFGKLTGGVESFVDVTGLIQAQKTAETATLAKSEFLANISHEMRTPLNGIIGMTELIEDTNLNDSQAKIFDTISSEAKSLVGIISDVLDFSKIEAGKFDLENIEFDLRHLLDNVSSSIAMRATQKGLEFISFLSPDVPRKVIGDPGRLRQILINLAGNSLKFTHKGDIFIDVEKLEDLEDRVTIRVSVKDTGIGIAKDKQKNIFQSFTQADGSTTRKYGGTGLGTAISRQLAEMMGGKIGVESEEGKGSTFWFTAELFKPQDTKAVPEIEDVDLNNLKVLVVDRNKNSRYIQIEYLKAWGCKPVEAMDGNDALSIYKKSVSSKDPFDLLLIGSLSPGTTGFDLAGQIRTIKVLKKIPIILITSLGWKGDSKICKDLEIEGYLTKPVKWDDLLEAIKLVLGICVDDKQPSSTTLVTRHTIAEAHRNEKKILLAEDYPANQQVALAHLGGAGYQVDLAENGQEAVDAYSKNYYDIILMDIQMPIMGGFDATKMIRSLEADFKKTSAEKIPPNRKRVPIIAMTAHAMEGYKKLCLEAGMDDYITKPLLRKGLLAIVDKWAVENAELETRINDQNYKEPIAKATSEIQDNADYPEASQSQADDENEPINYDKALEEFMGKKEILNKVVNVFLENVRKQKNILRQAIVTCDSDAIKKEAHSIKGGAANLTANKLSEIAFELENIGKSGEMKEASDVMDRFEKEFSRLELYLEDT